MAAVAAPPSRPIRLNAPHVNSLMELVRGHLYSNYGVNGNLGADTAERSRRYDLTVMVANGLEDRAEAARLLRQDATFTGAWLMLRPWIEAVLMELEDDLRRMVDKRRWPGHVINLVSRRMELVHERVAAVAALVAVPGASCAPRMLPHPLQALRKDLRSQLAIAPHAHPRAVTRKPVSAVL